MNYSTCNEPVALPNELKCCCTPESHERKVSMAELLNTTHDRLVNINHMLEKLDLYIFANAEKENLDLPSPDCMSDAVYQNMFLAGLAEEKLIRLVDRICV